MSGLRQQKSEVDKNSQFKIRPSRPDASLGFQSKVFEILQGVPSWLGIGSGGKW